MIETTSPAIRLDRYLPHPPAKVWRALTDPSLIARWWAAGDIRPVVGHRFELDMQSWGRVPCEVIDAHEPERLTFTFGDRWKITWRLVPEGDGTRLFLEHTRFDLSKAQDRFALENMEPGWRGHVLPELARVLDQM